MNGDDKAKGHNWPLTLATENSRRLLTCSLSSNLLLILAGLLIGALVMQWRLTRRCVGSIHVSRTVSNRIFAGQRFRIGSAVFEATQLCHPCARMEENLGKGGVAAMLGHGGLCAKIIESGDIAIGDEISVLPALED